MTNLDNSYISPLLSYPGAAALQETSLIDAEGVAWHYGDPLVEQRAAQESGAVVDRSQRAVIKVGGPDAPLFLNNLLSQKLDDAPDGFSASALDLDVQGHILHHMDLTRVGTDFFLDLPRPQAQTFVDYLRKMVFWSEVTIEITDLALLSILGATVEVPEAAFVREVPTWHLQRTDIALPRELLDAAIANITSSGICLAGLMAFTAERVRALEPELAADLDSKSIPHEVPGFIGSAHSPRAVHLNKGCYRGQETVSRVHNLGRSPRLLVQLHLDGSAMNLPNPGDELTAGDRKVGRMGTIVHDCDYGPIALALVKRSALNAKLSAGEVAVLVDSDSIPDDSGERPGRAAINRLRGQN